MAPRARVGGTGIVHDTKRPLLSRPRLLDVDATIKAPRCSSIFANARQRRRPEGCIADGQCHTKLSRRSAAMPLDLGLAGAKGPEHVVMDSTGLKVYGAGEWHREKHGSRGRRSWRRLHLAVDPDSGEILASDLTDKDVGESSQVGALLDQVVGDIASVTTDGAYDGDPVSQAVADRAPEATVVIPPRATATPSPQADQAPTQRDHHLQTIAQRGRRGWQRAIGYGRRSLGRDRDVSL
jgi:transposase